MRVARAMTLVIAAYFALTMAGSAYAETGTSGYLSWQSVAALPGQGSSPHGGYSTTTNKCAVCHSVHGATSPGEFLLPSTVSDACNYCHVGGAGGYTQVYGGDPTYYSGNDLDNAHNTFTNIDGVEGGVRCTNCHSVHAAGDKMTANAYLTEKMLVGAKTYVKKPANYDPIAKAPLSTDSSDTALSKWCAGCHFTKGGTYTYWGLQNGQSHVMTTATATYSNPATTESTQVAWANSTQCSSCHSAGYNTPAWPHYAGSQANSAEGIRWLESGANASSTPVPATDSKADGVCLRCHVNGTGTQGAGKSY